MVASPSFIVCLAPAGWLHDDHAQSQARMARLSRNGKQIIVTESGHHVRIDQPELVILALRDLNAATTEPR